MAKELRELLLYEGTSFLLGDSDIKKAVAVVLAARPTPQMLCDLSRQLIDECHGKSEKDQQRLYHAKFLAQLVMAHQLADHLGLMRARRAFDIEKLVPRDRWKTPSGEMIAMPYFNTSTFDHPVHFRERDRPWRPAAVVVNNYSFDESEMSDLLSTTPLRTQPLDFPNIYYPGRTNQILIVAR